MFLRRDWSHLRAVPIKVLDTHNRRPSNTEGTLSDRSNLTSRCDSGNILTESESSEKDILIQLQRDQSYPFLENNEDINKSGIASQSGMSASDIMTKVGDFIICLTCFIIAVTGFAVNHFGKHYSLEIFFENKLNVLKYRRISWYSRGQKYINYKLRNCRAQSVCIHKVDGTYDSLLYSCYYGNQNNERPSYVRTIAQRLIPFFYLASIGLWFYATFMIKDYDYTWKLGFYTELLATAMCIAFALYVQLRTDNNNKNSGYRYKLL